MNHRRLSSIAVLGLTVAAVAAPTAVARPDSPQLPREQQNLVTPDARDAMQSSSLAGTPSTIDRRTPDAQDAADGRGTWNAPDVTVVKVTDPSRTGTGLDWGDAGIGAGAVVGLMLLALGGALAIVHRRRGLQRPQPPVTTA